MVERFWRYTNFKSRAIPLAESFWPLNLKNKDFPRYLNSARWFVNITFTFRLFPAKTNNSILRNYRKSQFSGFFAQFGPNYPLITTKVTCQWCYPISYNIVHIWGHLQQKLTNIIWNIVKSILGPFRPFLPNLGKTRFFAKNRLCHFLRLLISNFMQKIRKN